MDKPAAIIGSAMIKLPRVLSSEKCVRVLERADFLMDRKKAVTL